MRSSVGGLVAALALALAAACSGEPAGGDGDADVDADADADGAADARDDRPVDGPSCLVALPVDILWVIDDSNSMQEEQNNLAMNFSDLVDVLTHPPDHDDDGREDYPPVEDLRVGVVTTDMGVGANLVTGCDATGDGGALVSTSRSADPACSGFVAGPPPWLSYVAGDDTAAFAEGFSCLARLGTEGCGFEQQLDAIVGALVDRAAPGGPNDGFLRQESLVAIVIVTDEDDCSSPDEAMFDASAEARAELGPFGTRCAVHPERLRAISEFVTALDPLRLDRPGGMLVAAITGVPPDLVADPETIDYDAILADERMQIRVDPADDSRLVPACSLTSVGSAAPARRLVDFVRTFSPGERGLVQSICSTDLSPAMEAIAELIARRLCDRPY